MLPERLPEFLVYLTLCRRRIGEGWYIWLRIRSLVCGGEQGSQITQGSQWYVDALGRSISARITIAAAFSRAGDRAVVVFAGRSDHRCFDQRHLWMVVKVIPSARVFRGGYVRETVEGGLARHVGPRI